MEEINLKRLLEVTLSLKWIIIGMMILMLAIGSLYSFVYVVPEYQSSIKLVLAQVVQDSTEGEKTNDAITSADITINNQLVATYTEIIKSKKIMRDVIDKLGLEIDEDVLSKKIKVSCIESTQVLKITVSDQNSEVARNIATEVANEFMKEIKSIYNISNVNIIDQAEVSDEPYNINHVKDLIIFEILGAFISAGLVLIVYLIDTTVKDEHDVENAFGLPTLGMIPLYKEEVEGEKSDLLSFEDSKSPITECFRTLRTNLVFAKNNNNLKNILVISSFSTEGKSYVSANLAMSFAKTNKKVIIIDADMRKGRQHKIFNLKNTRGLSNCLTKIEKFDSTSINQISKYVRNTEYPNVHLITSGTRPANPLELISSDKMLELISVLDKVYDYVIIDGTPTNIVSDSVALSKAVDATVLVAQYKKTKIEALDKVKKSIENVGGTITGVILNKCPITENAYTSKYYYAESINASEENEPELKEKDKKEVVKVQTFNELVKNIDFDNMDFENEDILNYRNEEVKADNKVVPKDSNFIDYKLENISSEISSLKDLMITMTMKSNENVNDSYRKEIEELKKEIESLKLKIK